MKNQILTHAKQCGEEECCGFIIDNKYYFACKNIAVDPRKYFEIAPEDWINAENQGQITAIVHSHPQGSPILSEADQFFQQQTKLDWWLVCNNEIYKFRFIKPLLGREFVHGITDCYTLFRDAYMLANIDMFNYERQEDWWSNGENLYLDLLPVIGFEQVQDVQKGDIILICLGSRVPNHAAIYLGDQMILHHCPKRLSTRDLYNGYWLKYTHSIWRHKQWQPSAFMAILNNLALNLK